MWQIVAELWSVLTTVELHSETVAVTKLYANVALTTYLLFSVKYFVFYWDIIGK